jgi:SAM-dependent methyltransferase
MKNRWTGERLETFVENETTVEHLHRYGVAMAFIKNKKVLDIASGEGYGSNLMALNASEVIGVDIDFDTIEKAKEKYKDPKLTFIQGSADKIPVKDSSVDVITSFETIEHHDKHDEMMNEIKRVLKPGGILLISSPEKTADVSGNPFHVKELSRIEFTDLIAGHFKFAKLYSQKIVHGSVIVPVGNQGSIPFEYMEGDYEKINVFKEMPHIFNIVIASDQPDLVLPGSFFDGSETLLQNIVMPYQNSRLYKLSKVLKKLLSLKW